VVAQYFVGVVGNEPVCHIACCPLFTANAYRATRLVVMPECTGAGIGTRFLEAIGQYHFDERGRCRHQFPMFFHTSPPQLCMALRSSDKWIQTGASLYGANKLRSKISLSLPRESNRKNSVPSGGYGGHL